MTDKLRVLFHPQATGTYTPEVNLRKINGLPHHSGRQLSGAYDYTDYLTNNHGNLVHYESVCKFLDVDLNRSCRANLGQVFRQFDGDAKRFNRFLTHNFDYVVISSINFITNTKGDNASYSRMADILKVLEVPFAIFGVGVQEAPTSDELGEMPHLATYLQTLNERATLFACRGSYTSQWCLDNGYANAVPTGCPSMYAYPDAVDRVLSNISRLSDDAGAWRFASAGKIHRKYRRSGLFKCFEPGDMIDYFFQDELKLLIGEQAPNSLKVYAPATGRLDNESVLKMARQHIDPKLTLPFDRMFFCPTPDAWRQQASNADVYIGDRLHGGIVCLQAGLPCIFLTDDHRVQEVADHFAMPCYSIKDVGGKPELVKQFRNRERLQEIYRGVQDMYAQRLTELKSLLAKAGLSLREL